jgi:1-acyl-sn-glycerol-3-phosphate acyltransferase
MKKILSVPYSFYVAVLFMTCLTILMILYIPLLLISNDRTRMRIIYFLNRIFLKGIWSTLSGIWVTVEGAENIDPNKTYVFVCNHSNALDIPFGASCIPHNYYKPLVKKELLSVPVMGVLLRITSLAVDRKSAESRKETSRKMAQWLKEGISLFIFPEGTRNRTEKPLKEFYDGAFKVAIAAEAEVAPFVYINLRALQPVDTKFIFPGKITMRFLPPIATKGMTEADTEGLKTKVYQQIEEVLLKEDSLFKK